MSKFLTVLACVVMKRLRGATSSPMRTSKISETFSQVLNIHEAYVEKLQEKPNLGAALIKNIPIGLPKILVDSKQIEEIFFNLIRNSAQAMDKPHGSITVEARNKDDDWVIVDITDTGCGITEEGLAMLFNPFYTTKGPDKGTGLGLYIVRQIIENNGGRILVKSKFGEGTTFTLEFQKARESTPDAKI